MRGLQAIATVAIFAGGLLLQANLSVAQDTAGAARLPLAISTVVDRAPASFAHAPGGVPGFVPGSRNGRAPRQSATAAAPRMFGTGKYPFTTAESAVEAFGSPNGSDFTPVTSYPWRATGSLEVNFGEEVVYCTASLIRPGVLVTAAHCIQKFGRGAAGRATAVEWTPADSPPFEPFGTWEGAFWVTLGVWPSGTDICQPNASGIICNNDIGLVVLESIEGDFPGEFLGWYGYAWNGYSFVENPWWGNRFTAQIKQLGYPIAHDSGHTQVSTDSVSTFYSTNFSGKVLKQQIIGSAQTAGADGGPWIVNFGKPLTYSPPASTPGTAPDLAVVGVTGWGLRAATANPQKILGASWFGQNAQYPGNHAPYGLGNIGRLVQIVCTNPTHSPACIEPP